jgi:hypothetical protein
MFRVIRIAVAAVLALAVATLPVMLDRCGVSCEAHQATVASTPACHDAAASGTHVARVPAPCGHDHADTTIIAANGFAASARAFALTAIVSNQPAVVAPPRPGARINPHATPNSLPARLALSLTLRL